VRRSELVGTKGVSLSALRADRHACGASNKGLGKESVGGEIVSKRLTTGRRKDKMENPRDNEANDRAAQAERPENNNHPGF
jgi:hypothetical protein